jgi:protein SCO1/2
MNRPVLLACVLAAGCAPEKPKQDPPPPAVAGFNGASMIPPRAKPEFTFTSDAGTPYDLRKETNGRLTYLFFGYTNCPDVCPLHMANLGAIYKKLPYSDQQRIRVVFVTTDPARDTPQRLRAWLDNFHPDFVGVSGPMDAVNALQQSMGMPPAVSETAPAGSKAGAYGVAHGAAVLTFTPDDSLRVLYPFGTRQQDFAEDVPRLLRFGARG